MRCRLLALDVDGTLLDPAGELAADVSAAVAEATARGVRVVLCTGRRFRTTRPVLERLGLTGSVVLHNGAVVKDAASGRTLHHRYLPPALHASVLTLLREVGPPLVYVDTFDEDTDILTERLEGAHPFQRRYFGDNTAVGRVVPDLLALRRDDVILMSTMADGETLRALRRRARETLGARVHTHWLENKSYEGYILEMLAPGAGKWPALRRLAAAEGIAPDEIVAVGDDANDAEMLRRAGLGVAMGNAVPEARDAADALVRSNAEHGLAEAIERFVLPTRPALPARRGATSLGGT